MDTLAKNSTEDNTDRLDRFCVDCQWYFPNTCKDLGWNAKGPPKPICALTVESITKRDLVTGEITHELIGWTCDKERENWFLTGTRRGSLENAENTGPSSSSQHPRLSLNHALNAARMDATLQQSPASYYLLGNTNHEPNVTSRSGRR